MILKFKLSKLFRLSSKSKSRFSRNRGETNQKKTGVRSFDKEYQLGAVIGKGGFGTVYSASRLSDGQEVAVKIVTKDSIVTLADDANVPLEVVLLRQVSDVPGVVKLLDYIETSSEYIIVMELLNCCDLFDLISRCGTLEEDVAKEIFSQVVDTVVRCQEKRVLHGDIKDENILIDFDTGAAKLIDFGSGSWAARLRDDDPVSGPELYNHYEGTRVYAPPEWLLYGQYTGEGLTVWSLGILLYDMLCGDIPFETDEQTLTSALTWYDNLSLGPASRNLIRGCLNRDIDERLSLDEVRSHPWLRTGADSGASMTLKLIRSRDDLRD